jgi:hypothetical protein
MNGNKGLYPIWWGARGRAAGRPGCGAFIFIQGHVLFNANDVLIWTLPWGLYFPRPVQLRADLLAALPSSSASRNMNPLQSDWCSCPSLPCAAGSWPSGWSSGRFCT